jgi:ribosomal protein S18 acetylase RimI-like enzyme
MIRETISDDKDAILSIICEAGQFDDPGMAYVAQILETHLNEGSDALWFTADDGEPVGVAYCAPEPVTSGTWNLLMLWIKEEKRKQGYGSALVTQVEKSLVDRRGRLLIVETSGLPEFESARIFYSKVGFTQEARIKDFFTIGDDKLIYTKSIT